MDGCSQKSTVKIWFGDKSSMADHIYYFPATIQYTVKTAVLFWHKIGHIWYYVTEKNREKQKDGTKFDPFVC